MIVRRIHVECDQCGTEATPSPGWGAGSVATARAMAAGLGFRRHEIAVGPLAGATLDLCAECQAKAGLR